LQVAMCFLKPDNRSYSACTVNIKVFSGISCWHLNRREKKQGEQSLGPEGGYEVISRDYITPESKSLVRFPATFACGGNISVPQLRSAPDEMCKQYLEWGRRGNILSVEVFEGWLFKLQKLQRGNPAMDMDRRQRFCWTADSLVGVDVHLYAELWCEYRMKSVFEVAPGNSFI